MLSILESHREAQRVHDRRAGYQKAGRSPHRRRSLAAPEEARPARERRRAPSLSEPQNASLRTFADASTLPFPADAQVVVEPLCRLRIDGSSAQESATSWIFASFSLQSGEKKQTVRKWVYESTLLAAFPDTALPVELSSLAKRLSMEADVSKESSLRELQQVSQAFEAYKKRTKAATLLLQERNEESAAQIAQLQQELAAAQQELASAQQREQQQRDDSSSALQSLQSQLADSTERLSALEAHKRDLEQSLAEKEASLSAKSKEIDELNAVVEAEQDLNDSRERDVQQLRGTVQQLRSEISQLIQKTAQSAVKSIDSADAVAVSPRKPAVTPPKPAAAAQEEEEEQVSVEREEPSASVEMPTVIRRSLGVSSDSRLSRFALFSELTKEVESESDRVLVSVTNSVDEASL